jgi:hypothetical protein
MSRDNLQGMSPTYPYGNNSPGQRNVGPYGQQNFQGMSAEKGLFNPQPMNNQGMYPGPQGQGFLGQGQPQGQGFALHPQQYNNLYMKRVGNATSMSIPSQPNQNEDFSMGQVMYQGYDFDQSPSYQGGMGEGMMFGQVYDGMPREKKKPIILDESQERYNGRLKFFDENKKYGFIVMDEDGSDIFVHYDDLVKANITKDLLRTARMGNVLRLNFGCMAYIGKYNRSRKAIDIQLLD